MLTNEPKILGGQLSDRMRLEKLEQNTKSADNKSKNIIYENNFNDITDLGTINLSNEALVPSDVLRIENGYLLVGEGVVTWPKILSRIHRQTTRIYFNTSDAIGFNIVSYGVENGGGSGTQMEYFMVISFSNNQIESRGTVLNYNFV